MKRPALLLLALAAIYLVDDPYITSLFVVCAIYTLPAIGLSLLMGYTGQISLGHAAFVGVGAYVSVLLGQALDVGPWWGVALATATSALAAWAVGWLVFRLRGHHLAMATLAFGLILHTVLVEWRSVTGGQDGLGSIAPLTVFGVELMSDHQVYPLVWLAALVALVLADNLVRSPVGLAMRTVGESEAVAGSIGIAAPRVKRAIMALSGAYAGLGGALYAHWLGYISPEPFNVGFSIKLLLIVALGGFIGIWNVLFGVFFVVVVSEWLKPLGQFDVVIYGLLLIFVMVYCRQGLVAGAAAAWRRLRFRRALGASVPAPALNKEKSA